jgi:hypothetical protein
VTPFRLLRLPVPVVRRRSDGRYLTLSKALLPPNATRLLSPLIEKRVLEAAAGRNYRPGRRGALALGAQPSECVVDLALCAVPRGEIYAINCRANGGYGKAAHEVILSDGDEGLERVREAEFPHATWLLDRWHIARAVGDFVSGKQEEYRRIMAAVWPSDSEAVLEALRTSESRSEQFHLLFWLRAGQPR